jgi:mannose-1-phosphate guanylyltransferase
VRLIAVILAGGRGERFWPLSRRSRPKQFLPLLGDRSMLATTLDRLDGLVDPGDRWIVTARDLEKEARRHAPGVPAAHVIGEPVGKNTAPAIGLMAWWLEDEGTDVAVVVLPSDHRVEPADRFQEEVREAARVALARQAIVTFGVPPTRPETGYGYIEAGEPVEQGSVFHRVRAFREKPDPVTAETYASDGRHLWNAGMFVFPPALMLQELRAHEPRLTDLLSRVPRHGDRSSLAALEPYYEAAPSISIDYAVMERSDKALVARARFAWDDLGSWEAVGDPGTRDAEGNTARGVVLLEDCGNVIAFADEGLIAAVGVRDLVIVRTPDVTLVCRRDRVQEVRAIVGRLKSREDLDGYR